MPLRRDSGGSREEGKGRVGEGRERKNREEEQKRERKKEGRKREKGTPQHLAPRGIFVGTLTPKTALKCDFASSSLRAHGSVAAFLKSRAPSNEKCDAAHFHSGWLWIAFRGVWGVL